MNIGLFGGTFDPIHRGHIALASAAQQRYQLGRIYFVPANIPPHKQKQPISAFPHRYAMVALATSADRRFLPSLLEAPAENGEHDNANYSIETIRRLKKTFKASDRLFFLLGIDAFREIATWHQAKNLFEECEFIVASRPGYSLADVAQALPKELRPANAVTRPFQKQPATGDLVLPKATVHLLESVHFDISATRIREAVASGKPLTKLVDESVADYIKKTGMYK
ncbi:MAG TPA: nicotinate-nucleotide adenylyltransferase [Terriglobales bacterium]|nr:nicotinate-nucleotide adenylyltransferase [Terriglobales bacterium]